MCIVEPCSSSGRKSEHGECEVQATTLVISRTLDMSPPKISLEQLAQGVMPLLLSISSFLDSPVDLINLCGLTCKSIASCYPLDDHPIWKQMYASRWPMIYEAMVYMGASDWRRAYQQTVSGQSKCLLEVQQREQRPEFRLSAMPAWVTWKLPACSKCDAKVSSKKAKCCMECGARLDEAAKEGCYVAKHISSTEQVTERIPQSDAAQRLRFCPAAVRGSLRPGSVPAAAEVREAQARGEDPASFAPYPYKAMKGVEAGLKVGGGVELQWKMQARNPFGWWYGRLESLDVECPGDRAFATIVFEQFPKDTPYHRQRVEFGDGKIRTNAAGGFTGGVRSCTTAEVNHWKLHGGL
eukprot:TRINITY_DN5629_c0_g1_i1.p1 TRINITY_DN5629_c0_g1~~TRINITY_DN5629_c0_g1_i1.p1  ORF type:complete len:353 (-),score=87.01 TRINITY_DN5629_c0_g1_i1:337-1395(-)